MISPKNDIYNKDLLILVNLWRYEDAIIRAEKLFNTSIDSDFENTRNDIFNVYSAYYYSSLEKGDYQKAEELIEILWEKERIDNDTHLHNLLELYSSRIRDHKIFDDKLNEILMKERYKTIEILWVFVAIVSFIFSGVSLIGKGMVSSDAINFLKVISSSLIVFIVILTIFLSIWSIDSKITWLRVLYFLLLIWILLTNIYFLIQF